MGAGSGLTRRAFLGAAAALPLAVSVAARAAARKTIPVGLELYSVRTELMRDPLATVTAVGKMGYQVVEFYAPYLDYTTEMVKNLRARMDDVGLVCHSTHNNAPSFTADGLKKAIELNQILGSRTIIMASAPRASSPEQWKALADQLTAIATTLRPSGMTTGYHNHQVEWTPVAGQRPMDIIAAGTPSDVVLQFDVGTCVEMGADPIAWIRGNPGRIRSVHCKDWGKGDGRGYAVAFGEGDAPWARIFEAAESAGGIEYYLIEQEQSGSAGELAMAQRCLANWKKMRG